MSIKSEDDKYEKLQAMGGLTALEKGLKTSSTEGIPDTEAPDYADRKTEFGANVYPKTPMAGFIQVCVVLSQFGCIKFICCLQLFFRAWKDETLIILTIAAIIALAAGVLFPEEGEEGTAWIDGAAIIVAVFVVCFVTAANDYSQERQFRALNDQKDDKAIKVIRNGENRIISIHDILVGDLVEVRHERTLKREKEEE